MRGCIAIVLLREFRSLGVAYPSPSFLLSTKWSSTSSDHELELESALRFAEVAIYLNIYKRCCWILYKSLHLYMVHREMATIIVFSDST